MQEYITVCERAARAGGAELLDWVGRFEVYEKGPADLVTEADLASNRAVERVIREAFPDHGIRSEEDTSPPPDTEYLWLVDPLDGTTNYVHQLPHYCVSVALSRRGELLAGAIFEPVAGDCYLAEAGGGARRNGDLLRVSGVPQMSKALSAASLPSSLSPDSPEVADFVRVAVASQSVRRTGSAALNLCYLAAGRFDVYWATTTHSWDVAAGILLVREAGGIVTAPDGAAIDLQSGAVAAAATAPLHEELLILLGKG